LQIQSKPANEQLKLDLVEHVWNRLGSSISWCVSEANMYPPVFCVPCL
jgi:hypothetical protein